MPIKKETFDYTARQVVLSSPKPIKAVVDALNYELNAEKAGVGLMYVMATAKTRDDLVNGIGRLTEGKRDFLLFAMGSHAQWMEAYHDGKEKFTQTIVFTLGNPLIAKDFLKHDMSCGLYVPPKLLVQETQNGGTRILYDLPSSIMVRGAATGEVRAALEGLDDKLERMVRRVLTADNKL